MVLARWNLPFDWNQKFGMRRLAWQQQQRPFFCVFQGRRSTKRGSSQSKHSTTINTVPTHSTRFRANDSLRLLLHRADGI